MTLDLFDDLPPPEPGRKRTRKPAAAATPPPAGAGGLLDALETPATAAVPEVAAPATALAREFPTPAAPLADHDDRECIRTALDDTLVVEAAAGTGKTSALVGRMVEVLAAGRTTLDRMVAVTFTEAAAGELKLRLRGEIERARLDPARPAQERERLTGALPRLEEARIGTIHSFCSDLLKEKPVDAGVDPAFRVAADDVARPLFDRAFARWFEGQLADPGPAVRRILRRWRREPMFRPGMRDEGPRGLLRSAAWALVEQRDFPTPWRHAENFERDARLDALLERMESLAEWSRRADPNDWFGKSLLEIAKAVDEVRRAERVRPRDHDWLEAWTGDLVRGRNKWWGWGRGNWRSGDPGFPRTELRDQRDALHQDLRQFVDDAGADLAPRLRDELWPVVEAYEAAKRRSGCLDFNDLLIRARDLVRDHPEVRAGLQRRFTHYYVDEFQDTDPLQVEILVLLAADDPAVNDWRRARVVPGRLFIVGDPKQSIYRFRRADVALYRDVQRRLLAQGARAIHLQVSFRSVPDIQEAVNAAFAPRMGGLPPDGADGAAAVAGGHYVPLAPFRESHPSQPAVIALPVPKPYGDYRRIVDWRIEESLPDVTAAWIRWLVQESGWTVSERERPGERVPVEPRHVCILFRRFKSFGDDVTRPYVAALEARHVPHLLVGGSSFHDREEIEAMRNALAAIERPDDELAVFATLRGPLLALPDAALLAWREDAGHLHPVRSAPDTVSAALPEVATALALLARLHRGRNRRPIASTIAALLEATRAHAAFAIWPTGVQALANVGRLMDLARRAEAQGLTSFRGFVEKLEDDAERGEVAEAALLEEGVEGVRIMTAHKAKGLEFPVVVLADMTASETLEQPLRWTDPARGLCVQRLAGCTPPELREHGHEEMEREREEAVRLLYVAATRARDVLVVPVIGDERRPGWLGALEPAVYPETQNARHPRTREAPGCPAFGEDSVPHRPDDVARPFTSVMPGVHPPEAGRHAVVWWDPAVLALDQRASMGLSQTRLLEADDQGRSAAALAGWEAWRDARAATREHGAKPQVVVHTATALAHALGAVAGANEVAIEQAGARTGRPSGTRFGALVHAVLSTVELDDPREGIAGHAQVHARILGAGDDEREAAVETVAATLAHPVLRRAAAAAREGRCRREAPIVTRLEDGSLLESVADLAFMDDGTWTVVDFKTDVELGERADAYRRQIALYVRGIAAATGMPARGVLLRV